MQRCRASFAPAESAPCCPPLDRLARLPCRRCASSAAGLLLRCFSAEGDGDAALLYDWATNRLELRFGTARLLPEAEAAGGRALACAALLFGQGLAASGAANRQ